MIKNHFMKVLVTGLDPLGGERVNQLMGSKLLPDQSLKGHRLLSSSFQLFLRKVYEIVKEAVEKDLSQMLLSMRSGRRTVLV